MTADDLRKRAYEAAYRDLYCGNDIDAEVFIQGALWHASTLPTLDVDELAEVIGGIHKRETETFPQYDRRRARAVIAHLTKGNENDE